MMDQKTFQAVMLQRIDLLTSMVKNNTVLVQWLVSNAKLLNQQQEFRMAETPPLDEALVHNLLLNLPGVTHHHQPTSAAAAAAAITANQMDEKSLQMNSITRLSSNSATNYQANPIIKMEIDFPIKTESDTHSDHLKAVESTAATADTGSIVKTEETTTAIAAAVQEQQQYSSNNSNETTVPATSQSLANNSDKKQVMDQPSSASDAPSQSAAVVVVPVPNDPNNQKESTATESQALSSPAKQNSSSGQPKRSTPESSESGAAAETAAVSVHETAHSKHTGTSHKRLCTAPNTTKNSSHSPNPSTGLSPSKNTNTSSNVPKDGSKDHSSLKNNDPAEGIAETEKRVKQVQASPQKSQPLITSPPPPTPTPPPSSLSSSFSSPSPSPSPSQSAAKKSKFFTAEVIQAATRRQPCVIKNCPDRMRMFEQDELNFHIRQAHNGRDIICMATPMCMETFRRGVDLTRHLNTVHEDIKEFACCGIVFSEYSRYWTHYVTCHQEKDYQCPRCPFTTKLLRLLDRHCFLNHENFRSGTPGSGKKGIFTSTGKPVESIKEEQ